MKMLIVTVKDKQTLERAPLAAIPENRLGREMEGLIKMFNKLEKDPSEFELEVVSIGELLPENERIVYQFEKKEIKELKKEETKNGVSNNV